MQRPLDAGPVVVAELADVLDDVVDVLLGHLAVEQDHLAGVKRASGRRPRSITISSRSVRLLSSRRRSQISGGQRLHQRVEVIGHLAACHGDRAVLSVVGSVGRHHRRLANRGPHLAHEERHPADRLEADRRRGVQARRLVCSHRSEDARSGRLPRRPAQHRMQEGGAVDAVADQEAQVVRALAAGAMLREAAAPAGRPASPSAPTDPKWRSGLRLLRGTTASWSTALPVGRAVALDPCDGGRRRVGPQVEEVPRVRAIRPAAPRRPGRRIVRAVRPVAAATRVDEGTEPRCPGHGAARAAGSRSAPGRRRRSPPARTARGSRARPRRPRGSGRRPAAALRHEGRGGAPSAPRPTSVRRRRRAR